ncbi:MAG: nickel pincer cofactor biosynthesis protein LarC [Candidatus Zixiibacteriota bacterium]|nr:MAG: nickel pincer cofactor biosynthesis protein LarC [candidate division Zixibacteria bacterium]
MKILYFDCFAGISGDMTLGALVDLGLPFVYLQKQLGRLNLTDYRMTHLKTERHKIAATKVNVEVTDDKTHRHLSDILALINEADLSPRVGEIARMVFEKLAHAEARVHQSTPEKIHFHEVGGTDAIVDIVGSAIGVEYFKPDRIYSSPVTLGTGTVKAAHGVIPIPAPATVEILKDFPVNITNLPGERVTPTGAAILVTLVEMYGGFSARPTLSVVDTGYGAGTCDFEDRPNFLRLFLGKAARGAYPARDEIEVLETNIDDMNPQIYGFLFEKLYRAGAHEVFLTPVIMKKNRPGNLLTVLCKKDLVESISDIIFSETTTAGIRFRAMERTVLERRELLLETDYGPIRIKILELKDGVKIQPEYDDCLQAAVRHQIPLAQLMETVRKLAEIKEGLS